MKHERFIMKQKKRQNQEWDNKRIKSKVSQRINSEVKFQT